MDSDPRMKPSSTASVATGSLANQTIVSAGWMVAWRMVTRLMGLGSTLVLARLLVPGDFGLIAMATTFVGAVDSLSAVGIQDALVRRQSNDHDMLNTAFTIQLLRGFLTAVVIWAATIPISNWFDEPRLRAIMLILGGLAAIGGFENIGVAEFRHQLRFDKEFKLLFLPRICSIAITIGGAMAFHTYWALVAGVVASKLFRVVMTYVAHPFRPRLSMRSWEELAGFSFWTWASSLASLVWERAGLFVYGPILGAALLGVYTLSVEIAVLPLTELVGPAATALFAGVARAQDRGRDSLAMACPLALTMSLITTPLAIGISATSGYVVASLLGSKWDAARPLIAIISFVCVFAPYSFVSATVLIARGHVRRSFFGIASASAAQLVVLAVISSVTKRPEPFAYAGLGLSMLEALFLLYQLSAVQRIDPTPLIRPGARLMTSSLATAAVFYFTGLGWKPTTLSGLPALAVGISLGIGILTFFATIQIALWRFDRWRDGPESRLLSLIQPTWHRLRLRRA